MATQNFSNEFPFAYHVLPLFAVHGVWKDCALKSKGNLSSQVTRPTTKNIDSQMGFANYVHCYLSQNLVFEKFPILAAQLGASPAPPFPHVLLQMPTKTLVTDQAVVCNWNIAVSRPNVPGFAKGGNWTRGTRSDRIIAVWQAFRNSAPSLWQARGLWYEEFQLPVLRGEAIHKHLNLILKRARDNMPELLIPQQIDLPPGTLLYVFSQNAFDILSESEIPKQVTLVRSTFPGYIPEQVEAQTWRALREFVLTGNTTTTETFIFDAVRKRL